MSQDALLWLRRDQSTTRRIGPFGCMLNAVLAFLAVWLFLLVAGSPLLDGFARLWFILRDFVVSILVSIWHFLGG
jgi:hypothetical protein